MKIAAAYVRVSTDGQLELSPDSQIKAIREYAKKNGYILPDEYIFQDDGISGRTASKRPEFNRMIGIAKTKPKPFDAILLWKFSRFARNREDSIVYKSMLRKQCGIDVISISENVGDDKMSVLIEALIEAMDEYYSVNLAEEVKRGMYEKFQRGGITGTAPFGYKIKDGDYVPSEYADTVRHIFNDFNAGKPLRTIAKELNAQGIKTIRGNLWDNRGIEYLLQNPVYIGKHRWNINGHTNRDYYGDDVEIADGTHEAIISEDIFNKAKEIIDERKRKRKKHSHPAHKEDYLFRGLIRCSNCGATLTQSAKNAGMQCHNYARGQCSISHYVSFNNLTTAVIEQLKKDAQNGMLHINYKPSSDVESQNKHIDTLITNEKKKLQRIKDAYTNGIDTLEEYKSNKSAIEKVIAEFESKKSNSEPKHNLKAFKKQIKSTIEILENNSLSAETKNSALNGIVEKIVFNRQNSTIQIYYSSTATDYKFLQSGGLNCKKI